MNLLMEIDQLPRSSRVTLAAKILQRDRPSVKELADAAAVAPSSVYRWVATLTMRNCPRAFPESSNKARVLENLRKGAMSAKTIREITGMELRTIHRILQELTKAGVAQVEQVAGEGRCSYQMWAVAAQPDPALVMSGDGGDRS